MLQYCSHHGISSCHHHFIRGEKNPQRSRGGCFGWKLFCIVQFKIYGFPANSIHLMWIDTNADPCPFTFLVYYTTYHPPRQGGADCDDGARGQRCGHAGLTGNRSRIRKFLFCFALCLIEGAPAPRTAALGRIANASTLSNHAKDRYARATRQRCA